MGAEYQVLFPVNLMGMIEACRNYENIKVALVSAIQFRHILTQFFGLSDEWSSKIYWFWGNGS